MGRLDGKVAIVTGGSRGMGESHVRAFVREGARVVIADRLIDEGQALANEMGNDVAVFVECDVSQRSSWNEVMRQANDAFGDVSVLVNNAGILKLHSLSDATEADFMKVMQVNQLGVFHGMQCVVPGMLRLGGGSIVNIASAVSLVGAEGIFGYTASKWAVRGMTKSAALELATTGIRVNAVHPSEIQTPMTAEMEAAGAGISADVVPVKRFGQPHEVTAVVLFLASDESSFVTGSDYAVDGGYCAA